MAKNKSNKSARPNSTRPAGRANSKAPASEAAPSVAPAEATPRPVGPMTGIEIGHVGGDVWGALTRHGELTLAALKKEVPAPADMVLAAIGWLARENKLEFSTTGRTIKISLR